MENKLTVENLMASHFNNDIHTLEFELDGETVFVDYEMGPTENEFYWDNEENVKKAVENGDIESEENEMYQLTIEEQGELRLNEEFDSFEELKENLIEKNYFGWVNDNEPDKELPDFTEVETLEEIKAVFEEFDYSWWTVSVEMR